DDTVILEQPVYVARSVAGNFRGLEIVKGFAEILPLAQDRDPAQAGLKTVQHQFFVKRAAVIFWHTPFGVVVRDIERIFARPLAACFFLHAFNHAGLVTLTTMFAAVSGPRVCSRRSSRTNAKPSSP